MKYHAFCLGAQVENKTFESHSHEDTQAFATKLAHSLVAPRVIALVGDLGAGKTTFVQAFVKALKHGDKARVKSPSFALHHEYGTDPVCHHLDLYRLNDVGHFEALGLQDVIDNEQGFVLIEWPELILNQLPKNRILLRIEESGADSRTIHLSTIDSVDK